MTEDPYLTRIEEYLDESLPDALTAEVEAHLAQCAD
jgi:anti-sigma factor RsiW